MPFLHCISSFEGVFLIKLYNRQSPETFQQYEYFKSTRICIEFVKEIRLPDLQTSKDSTS